MRFEELPTPAFLVDRNVVERNCTAMREKALRSRAVLRPHVKTHKTIEAAKMQHGGTIGPITVSTLAEAEFFADGGFDDITYAFPIDPAKLARASALARRIRRLTLLLDHAEALRAVEEYAMRNRVVFDVMLKVDCGYGRAGVDPESAESIELARWMISSPAIRFGGFLTHAGHSYHARSREDILAIAGQEAEAVKRIHDAVARAGTSSSLSPFSHREEDQRRHDASPTAMVRSIGSTPTAALTERFDADEVRPGNYVFFDAFQVGLGSCRLEQCAASVITTVVGVYPSQRKVIVDAGTLALAREPASPGSEGHGIVCDLAFRPIAAQVASMSQEHGQIVEVTAGALSTIAVGSRLRIIPNHSCITAALHERYFICEGEQVTGEWRPVRGW